MDPNTRNFKWFRPMIFTTECEVGNADGETGKNGVPINNRPFILKKVTHQVIKPVDFPNGFDPTVNTNYAAFQHGLYTIDWSLYNRDRYWQGTNPPMADAAFGSVRTGIWIPLEAPLTVPKNETINVVVGNVGLKRSDYTVQIQFHGVEDYREYDQAGNLKPGQE